jgi:hypothetical protein
LLLTVLPSLVLLFQLCNFGQCCQASSCCTCFVLNSVAKPRPVVPALYF